MEDPQIVSAIISAQQTSIATLEAAYWTAGATVVSACLGAAGIIFAAWFAWKSGINLHQKNNILEAKREVYLGAIANWHKLSQDLSLINTKPDSFFDIFLENNREFFILIKKVDLICNSNNKKIVSDFSELVVTKLSDLVEDFNSFIATKAMIEITENELASLSSEGEFLQKYFLKLDGDEESIKLKLRINDFLSRIDTLSLQRNAQESQFKDIQSKVRINVNNFINETYEKSDEFASVLRGELNIK